MRLFRRSRIRTGTAKAETLEQEVTRLQATLATCKGIAQRREHWLVAAVGAVILLVGFMVVFNREPIEQAITEWIPGLGTSQPVQEIDAAYNAYRDGNYETAMEHSRPLAEQGDARAQSLVGLIYYHGRGVPRNEHEAMNWFRRAANNGDAVAQLYIGNMYSDGRSVPQDFSEAARWYQLAAEHGLAEAQYNLGIAYATGTGMPQDNILAHMWFNLAAAGMTASIPRDRAIRNRDVVARKMSPDEIARAQELARDWRPK